MISALMGRTSKELDDAYSVSSQIDAGLAYAAAANLTVPEDLIFKEDFSGRFLDRPELTKIRALVKAKKIHALVVYSVDRLARKVSVGEILLDEMLEYGVELHIVRWNAAFRDTPEDRLRFNFETTVSGFEHGIIVERTQRGKNKKASQGYLMGDARPQYGYRYNSHRTNFDHSPYAPIAREILIRYGVEQIRATRIVDWLDAEGHEPPGLIYYRELMEQYDARHELGLLNDEDYLERVKIAERRRGNGKWTPAAVYNICRKYEVYAGTLRYHFGKNEYVVQIPPLISQQEAADIKRMLAVGKSRTQRKNQTKYDFLMARRISCAECKHTYVVQYNNRGYCYYRCNGKSKYLGYVCAAPPIVRDIVDEKAKAFVRELLLNPRRLFAWWKEQHSVTEQIQEQQTQDIQTLETKVRSITEKYHRTLDRLTDNLDDDEIAYYGQQRDNLKELLGEYREEVELLLSKQTVVDVSEEVITGFLEMGQDYRYALEHSTDFTFWRGLIDDLDVESLIGVDEGQRYIEFIVFGKTRKRVYLTTEPSSGSGEQS